MSWQAPHCFMVYIYTEAVVPELLENLEGMFPLTENGQWIMN